MARIDPIVDLAGELMSVEKPARYVGGEYGTVPADIDATVRVAVVFPDLYEIGMSNLAIRLLYRLLNSLDGVSCERAFVPASDFEAVLRNRDMRLFSLESGTELSDFDVIAVTVGYELAATNILAVLDLGGIPIHSSRRGEGDPIVIAGGPAMTNPRPFERFFDGIFIGEAEGELPSLFEALVTTKRTGGSRESLLSIVRRHPSMWFEERTEPVTRSVWNRFSNSWVGPLMPVASMGIVQDHGVVEVMRGCPNGCRFCHAGVFYRPWREKPIALVISEVEAQISRCGYREVTISSLSTGDYTGIAQLVPALNARFSDLHVSFSLPSLRVDSFTLPLLSEVSAVRKSGLTFAVETPVPAWQRGVNKEVSLDKVSAIMKEARSRGWRMAKFYFMLGLPTACGEDETDAIAEFLSEVESRSGMSLNVNVNTFVPKPHTPFQWAAQLPPSVARERMTGLKKRVRSSRITVKTTDPFPSFVEGLIARGSSDTGALIQRAYDNGARFDAWDDQMDRAAWRKALAEEVGGAGSESDLRQIDFDDDLPWDSVNVGVTKAFLRHEYSKAMASELTAPCSEHCSRSCGICTPSCGVRTSGSDVGSAGSIDAGVSDTGVDASGEEVVSLLRVDRSTERTRWYMVFSYEKRQTAVYLSHLNVLSVFERSFLRAGIDVAYTKGFNPKPRLEFAHPLSLGFGSRDEVARVELNSDTDEEVFIRDINGAVPPGFRIVRAMSLSSEDGKKPPSLMSLYWGSLYSIHERPTNTNGHAGGAATPAVTTAINEYAVGCGLQGKITVVGPEVGDSADHILVRIEQAGKETSVFRMLQTLAGSGRLSRSFPAGYQVERLESYFRSQDGEPVSLFDGR